MRDKKGTGSLASIRGWETMRKNKYCSTQQGQAIDAASAKGVIAGQRRPAGEEGIGGWQEIPNMERYRSSEFDIYPLVGNDAEIKYRGTKLGQAIGTASTKGEVAGHRRPAGAEGIGRWQEIPNIGR